MGLEVLSLPLSLPSPPKMSDCSYSAPVPFIFQWGVKRVNGLVQEHKIIGMAHNTEQIVLIYDNDKGWFSLAHKHRHKPTYAESVRC